MNHNSLYLLRHTNSQIRMHIIASFIKIINKYNVFAVYWFKSAMVLTNETVLSWICADYNGLLNCANFIFIAYCLGKLLATVYNKSIKRECWTLDRSRTNTLSIIEPISYHKSAYFVDTFYSWQRLLIGNDNTEDGVSYIYGFLCW